MSDQKYFEMHRASGTRIGGPAMYLGEVHTFVDPALRVLDNSGDALIITRLERSPGRCAPEDCCGALDHVLTAASLVGTPSLARTLLRAAAHRLWLDLLDSIHRGVFRRRETRDRWMNKAKEYKEILP